MANEKPTDLPFPALGIDEGGPYADQPPKTTPIGVNVRFFDSTTDRGRGASRPALVKHIGRIPEGHHVIQHLNTVVLASADALLGNFPIPDFDGIDDPSSPGPSGSWGTAPLFDDPNTGDPTTGATEEDRVPRGPGGNKPKRRKGGSGAQPNKNVAPAPGGGSGNYYCTTYVAHYITHLVSGSPVFNYEGVAFDPPAVSCLLWTTIDEANFPAAVAAQKAAYVPKTDSYIPIVNSKQIWLTQINNQNPGCVFDVEFIGATINTPSPANTCNYAVPNYCGDPHY